MESEERKTHHLSELNVPGILWVFMLMGLMYFAPTFLPEFTIPFLPFIVASICAAANYFLPNHPRVKELRAIAEILLHAQRAPAASLQETQASTGITQEHIDQAAKGSGIGKILWG